jgi:transcriptional regulator with XRE-family HTH domain
MVVSVMETNFRTQPPCHLDEIKVKTRLLEIQRATGVPLTGREIARRLKVTPGSISRHIKGQRNNPAVQRGIAKLLGVELSQLIQEDHV